MVFFAVATPSNTDRRCQEVPVGSEVSAAVDEENWDDEVFEANVDISQFGRYLRSRFIFSFLIFRLEIAGSIPAAAPSSATSGKLFTDIFHCLQAV